MALRLSRRTAWSAMALALACAHPSLAPARAAARPPREGAALPRKEAPAAALGSSHVEPELAGVIHVVKRGETVYRIAKSYGLSPRELMAVNGLRDPRQLEIGAELFIPGATSNVEVPPLAEGSAAKGEKGERGEAEAHPPDRSRKVAPPPNANHNAKLLWPLKGVLYSRFGIRQGHRHDGIDVSAPEGTSIAAAADGLVVYTGEQTGYGSIVILRHEALGLLTLYAHTSSILVHSGDRVAAGAPIAKVGHTGRTSGPHLHFEVREGTRPKDPLAYLP